MAKQEKAKKVKKEKKKVNLFKNKRALQNGGYSVSLSVIVIAVVVVINLIIAQIPSKYTEFDISTNKLYTISDETIELLGTLQEDITIYHVVQSGSEDSNVEKLLEQYTANSSHIKVEKKDPVVYPNFVSTYTDESLYDNSLIVVGSKRNKIISISSIYETEFDYSTYQSTTTGFDGEGQITGALEYVTSDELPVLYYVTGHNELTIPDSLKTRIEKANLELQELSLLVSNNVPTDAAGILLNSPESDYSEEETEKILKYLKNGGKAMIISDYLGTDLPNFKSILKEYGVEVVDGLVVEGDANRYVQNPYIIVPEIQSTDITSSMTDGSQYVLLNACQGFTKAEEGRENLLVTSLLSTSDDSFVKMDPQNMTSYEKEKGDVDGPFVVGAYITETISDEDEDSTVSGADQALTEYADEETEDGEQTQIVCFASSGIMNESVNSMVSDGNYNLYMNSLNWLVDTEEMSNISIPSKSVETEFLTVTAAQGIIFGILLCFALPILCLIVGGVVCFRRKRK